MAYELPPLPYEKSELAPHISEETLEFHHGKHHQAYVTKMNELTDGTVNTEEDLIRTILESDGPLFNNSAQVWNHTFYWHSMKAHAGGEPTGEVAEKINSAFGTYKDFRDKFTEAATTQFGSGWAWLIEGDKGLEVIRTSNADNPLNNGDKALVTIDVWEHAYYIDFRNARPNYISAYLDNLLNWDFVAENLAK